MQPANIFYPNDMSRCHARAIIRTEDDETGAAGAPARATSAPPREGRMLKRLDLMLRRRRPPARPAAGEARASRPPPRRPAPGLSPREAARPMQTAALRVLETTWRLWREPVA